ncbi:MmgE/PrpD family protein [Mesorhizobium comanense]|uniref:MmgE/PrpD family protein n=1 Tax=Mesorhizobium comanense TaxID=2502215 RepID=UPI0010F5BE2C|nr:MmgE/PrpD family protein [Mesorhizobium comanense]
MSLTRDLTRLIREKPVTDSDLKWASLFVLDTLGCALGALPTAPARMLKAVAPPERADTARKAFYLGGLSHILEMDDLHRDSVTHPGSVVIPAAWAVAHDQDLGGEAFLKAVLAGYEACCRIGNSVGKKHYRVWHNTSTCGPFGSAMAVAELIGLDDDKTVWALGNAGTQSSGLWEFLAEGAMSKHLHTARAAESGVLASFLAREGFTGAENILEGDKGFYAGLCPDPIPEAVTAGSERPWQLINTSIKPWPCCRHTHPAIDGAIALHHEIAGEPIARVLVGAYRAALDVCDRPSPEDPYSAKFSLQHTVAIALADGRVDQASFDSDARQRMVGERQKVDVDLAPGIEAAYPESWGAEIQVETVSGRRLSASRHDAKGDPDNPVTAAELTEKAHTQLVAGGCSGARADALISAILGLTDNRPVRALNLFEDTGDARPQVRAARSA